VQNEEEKDMPAIREVRPMVADFETEEQREDFIKWASSKQKTNSESFEQMRREMKEIRKIRNRGKKKDD